MKKLLIICLLLLSILSVKSESIGLILGGLPSVDVITHIKISYGSQVKTYTNYVLFPTNTWRWVTNAPVTSMNLQTCQQELIPCYIPVSISGLVGGQIFYFKVTYIWKGGGEGSTIWESLCPVKVPISGNRPSAPKNLRIIL